MNIRPADLPPSPWDVMSFFCLRIYLKMQYDTELKSNSSPIKKIEIHPTVFTAEFVQEGLLILISMKTFLS